MDYKVRITRDELRESIEAGIKAAQPQHEDGIPGTVVLSSSGADKLRAVAADADRVVTGDYYDDATDCGCPLVQAGYRDKNGMQPQGVEEVWGFVNAFDGFWRIKLNIPMTGGRRLLEVVA